MLKTSGKWSELQREIKRENKHVGITGDTKVLKSKFSDRRNDCRSPGAMEAPACRQVRVEDGGTAQSEQLRLPYFG